MKMKILGIVVVGVTLIQSPVFAHHRCEVLHKGIHATVEFLSPMGNTVTNAKGTTYNINGYGTVIDTALVYIKRLWGDVPLYFMGQNVSINVVVTNYRHRTVYVQLLADSYELTPKGQLGTQFGGSPTWRVRLEPGKSTSLNGVISVPTSGLSSGLDITLIKMLPKGEHGDRDDDGDDHHKVIGKGVWCPPSAAEVASIKK